ncbi:hypothetical protein OLQ22_07710 [Campylobacter jejuni]|nr:hypothetical protein [Campylobacter jejuni]
MPKIIKNLAKNNANLEDFSDHEKALKYKNHLSYKLGNALIKAHKLGINVDT